MHKTHCSETGDMRSQARSKLYQYFMVGSEHILRFRFNSCL